MFDSEAEMARLQAMLAHLARANEHMTSIVTPERRLTARQVVTSYRHEACRVRDGHVAVRIRAVATSA